MASATWCQRCGSDEAVAAKRLRLRLRRGVGGELAVATWRQIGEAGAVAVMRWRAALSVLKPATNTHTRLVRERGAHRWACCGFSPQRDLDRSDAVELGLHPRQQRLDDGLVEIKFLSVQRYL